MKVMEPIDSPCTKICTLHPLRQICTGCGRTIEEIAAWSSLSRERRIGVIDIARARLQTLRENDSSLL
jgi:predicted Fe-S protein YdhL (DUF1289 family)